MHGEQLMKRLTAGQRSKYKRLSVLSPKWIIFINPLTKAQVTWPRRQKEYKSQRIGRSDMKCCFLDMTWLLHLQTCNSSYPPKTYTGSGLPKSQHRHGRSSHGRTHNWGVVRSRQFLGEGELFRFRGGPWMRLLILQWMAPYSGT